MKLARMEFDLNLEAPEFLGKEATKRGVLSDCFYESRFSSAHQ